MQFERVEDEIAIQNQKNLNLNITHVFQRADPASRRRDRPRRSERTRNENGRNDRGDRGRESKKGEKKIVNNQQNKVIHENAS